MNKDKNVDLTEIDLNSSIEKGKVAIENIFREISEEEILLVSGGSKSSCGSGPGGCSTMS